MFKESISIFECQAHGGILIKHVVTKLNRKCRSHSFAFPSAEIFCLLFFIFLSPKPGTEPCMESAQFFVEFIYRIPNPVAELLLRKNTIQSK